MCKVNKCSGAKDHHGADAASRTSVPHDSRVTTEMASPKSNNCLQDRDLKAASHIDLLFTIVISKSSSTLLYSSPVL